MRKAFLTVLLVSVIVFVSISFMGASCVVGPGPGPGPTLYQITLTNTFGEPVTIQVWDTTAWSTIQDSKYVPIGSTRSVFGYYGEYFRVYGENFPQGYYTFSSTGNTWYMITGNKSFSGGGGWVTEGR